MTGPDVASVDFKTVVIPLTSISESQDATAYAKKVTRVGAMSVTTITPPFPP
jgi:hypothetical protein